MTPAQRAIDAMKDKNGWRPKETTPEDNPFTCLVFMRIGPHKNHTTITVGFRYRGVWFANATSDCGHKITHWMPLPPPPEDTKE